MNTTYRIEENKTYNSIEIYFDNKPEEATRDILKSNKMRWNGKKACWYGFIDAATISAALNGEEQPTTTTKSEKAATLAPLWERCDVSTIPEHCRTLDTKTIAKECREHFKKQFPEVKISCCIGRGGWASCNEVNCHVVASPYEKASRDYNRYADAETVRREATPLQAILFYCEKYLDSYNYDNSDTQSDYFDVNFYASVSVAYDYNQTETTPAIIADIENYENSRAAYVAEYEKAQEEAYKNYLIESENARKEAEKREKERAEKAANIENHVIIADVPENAHMRISGLRGGIGKECNIEELRESIREHGAHIETAEITKQIIFTDASIYNDFCNMFLYDFSFLAGTGGTATDDIRVNNDNINKLTAEQREKVTFYMCNAVAVYLNNKLMLVIDSEGFSYARYVYIVPEGATLAETTPDNNENAPAFYFPEPVAKQAENIKCGDVVTLLTLNPWTLTVEHVTCFIESVKIANYAQYKNALYLTYRTGKNGAKANSMWIHDNTNAVIFSDVLPDVPAELKHTKITNNLYVFSYAGNGARDYIITAAEYYKSIGYSVLLDTIQR